MSNSPMKSIDKLFSVLNHINKSEKPLNTIDISSELGYSVRTVQRLAMRLATEGLVDFKAGGKNTYVYFKLGG